MASFDVRYRQIDFLRLFRLCKDLGLVSGKRKMPTEYMSDNERRNACKRLLTLVAKNSFKDYRISINQSSLYLYVPESINSPLRQVINEVYNSYSWPVVLTLPEEAMRQLNDLYNFNDDTFGHGFVSISFPQSIIFRYNPYSNSGTITNNSFYYCAIECINFKKYWDEHVDFILSAYKEAKSGNDNARKELEKKKAAENLIKQQEEIQRQQQRQQESQQLFNQALATHLANMAK